MLMSNPPTPEGLTARAAEVHHLGLKLLTVCSYEELQELWRRLPNVKSTSPPAGQRNLADRCALYLIDENLTAIDPKTYIAEHPALRDIPPPEDRPTNHEQEGLTMTETATAEAGKPKPTPPKKAKAPTAKAGGSDPKAANGGPVGASKKGLAAPKTTTKASGGKDTPVSKKKGTKAVSGAPKVSSGAGKKVPSGVTGLVIQLTRDGKDQKEIATAISKAYPGSTSAKAVESGSMYPITYYQWVGRKRGLLPALKK